MQKQPNIKWRESDVKKLSSVVKKFNAKRRRLIKKNPELAQYYPDTAKVRDLRKSIKTRKTYNNTIKSLERFLKKGAEQIVELPSGTKVTKYEKREATIAFNRRERIKDNLRKQRDFSSEKGNTRLERESNLNPGKLNIDQISQRNWKKFFKSIETSARSEYYAERDAQYAKNYLKALTDAYGKKRLYNLVSKLDYTVIVDGYYEENALTIDEFYTPEDMKEQEIYIYENWLKYLKQRDIIKNYSIDKKGNYHYEWTKKE